MKFRRKTYGLTLIRRINFQRKFVGVGKLFGCRIYHHLVAIVTQTVKWLVLVVQVLWGKFLGNSSFFTIYEFQNSIYS